MKENENGSINIMSLLLFIALVIIVIMGVFMFKISNEKDIEVKKSEALQAEVDTLKNNVNDLQGKIDTISATINPNTKSENKSEKDTSNEEFEDVVLDGKYRIVGEASEQFWVFTKDGKAAYSNINSTDIGTYKTIKENYVEINYTKEKDYSDESGKVKTSDTNRRDHITTEDGKIVIEFENGNKAQLEKIGEAVTNIFE